MDCNQRLLDVLAHSHTEYIRSKPEYVLLRNALIEGALTNKIEKRGDQYFVRNFNFDVLRDWKQLSQELSEKKTFHIIDHPFCCYRAVSARSLSVNHGVIARNFLPISATLDLNMALDWVKLKENGHLLKIILERDVKYTILDELGERDSEVILPPGDVIVKEKSYIENIPIYTCSYRPVDYSIREDLSLYDPRTLPKPLAKTQTPWKPRSNR